MAISPPSGPIASEIHLSCEVAIRSGVVGLIIASRAVVSLTSASYVTTVMPAALACCSERRDGVGVGGGDDDRVDALLDLGVDELGLRRARCLGRADLLAGRAELGARLLGADEGGVEVGVVDRLRDDGDLQTGLQCRRRRRRGGRSAAGRPCVARRSCRGGVRPPVSDDECRSSLDPQAPSIASAKPTAAISSELACACVSPGCFDGRTVGVDRDDVLVGTLRGVDRRRAAVALLGDGFGRAR